MKDYDAIWRFQDEIRTVVNAVLGECIWNLSYDEGRRAIVLLPITTGVDRKGQDSLFTWILNNKQDSIQVLFIVFATFFHLFTNFFPATKKGFICLSYLCTRKLMEVWLRG